MGQTQDLSDLFKRFRVEGSYHSAELIEAGHINDTYFVRTAETGHVDYLFQRVNQAVFKDIPSLMENIQRVTSHLHAKIAELPNGKPAKEALTLIPAHDGKPYTMDDNGEYWRVYVFIPNMRSYDQVPDEEIAFEGGRAFGRFQRLLADMPAPPLNETIPHFHNIEYRLDQFMDALAADPCARAAQVAPEIEFIEARFEKMRDLNKLAMAGKIPMRVVHNDTKFNNVLIDDQSKTVCVIDLDTVMPGLVHYDFGDAIRIAANTACEDETDLKKVGLDLALFEAFTNGFMSELRDTLTTLEKEYLVFAAKFMPFLIGVRFLTDYIQGDTYFKTQRPHHNLDRARCQFELVRSVEDQTSQLEKVLDAF